MKRFLDPRLKLNGWLAPGLVALVLLLQLLTPYKGWRILLVGLGGAWLLSYLWSRTLARGLRLTRERRFGWAQVGDQMVERFTLENNSWIPGLWVEIMDHSTLPGYRVGRGTGVTADSAIRWHTEAVCNRRGLFVLGPTSLRTGDPLGFYTVTLDYPASTPLLVLPPIVPLPAIEVAPGGRAGEGRPRANAPERTVSASGVREYAPGDSLRWIHWPTSARRGELYVRLFDSTPAGDWWICLDLDRRVQLGEGADSTEEHGVILAASLADRGIRDGQAVGLVTHGQSLVWLKPEAGDGQRWEILRALALVNRGTVPLAELLARTGATIGQRASLVLITADAAGGWVEALVPILRRGVIPTVLLLDPLSFGGTQTVTSTTTLLTQMGVAHYVITRDLLDRPEARPGRQGQWEWRVLGTGRAVPLHPRLDTGWRTLG